MLISTHHKIAEYSELEGMFTNTGTAKLHDKNLCLYVCKEKLMCLLQCWKCGTPKR